MKLVGCRVTDTLKLCYNAHFGSQSKWAL